MKSEKNDRGWVHVSSIIRRVAMFLIYEQCERMIIYRIDKLQSSAKSSTCTSIGIRISEDSEPAPRDPVSEPSATARRRSCCAAAALLREAERVGWQGVALLLTSSSLF